jgi:choline dehydrogenase-like flavoprotein
LAENAEASVLLLEAGGSDDVPSIMEAGQWPLNLGSERDWAFMGQPNPHLNGRSIPLNMGKILGGGSSINVMAWARGHKNDWDFLRPRLGTPHGAMNRYSTFIAALKIGMARRTRNVAGREDIACDPLSTGPNVRLARRMRGHCPMSGFTGLSLPRGETRRKPGC